MTSSAGKVGGGMLALVLIVVFSIIGGVVTFLTSLSGDPETLTELCEQQRSVGTMPGVILGELSSPEQLQNAQLIVRVGKSRKDLYARDLQLGLMVAAQESRWKNVPPGQGDRDSIGLFQQRPSQGWGTPEQLSDPVYATNAFFNALVAIEDRNQYSLLEQALMVQRPSEEAYSTFLNWTTAAETVLKGTVGSVELLPEELCDYLLGSDGTVDPLEAFVQAALTKVDTPYDESPPTGAQLVSEAASQAGFSLPNDMEGLLDLPDSEEDGVSAEYIAAEDLQDGPVRGDVPLISTDSDDEPEQVGVATGSVGVSSSVIVASYNVLGKSHTPGQGWVNRMARSWQLITSSNFGVVGLQEFEPLQRDEFLRLSDGDWGIYPQTPTYGGSNNASINSIVWDSSLYELVEADSGTLPMPYYFGGDEKQIPLVKLRVIASGEEFFVTNTHDPARPENARLRLLDAQQHADDLEALAAQDIPVIMTGDFNSGFAVRSEGNTTFEGKRENLTWCILTASGTMRNTYDAVRGRKGCPAATSEEQGIGPVDHVYVSDDVSVRSHTVIPVSKTASDHPVVWAEVFFGAPTSIAGPGTDIRFSTYNIQVGAGYQARVNRAHQLIRENQLQIIGFQEVENKAMYDALAAKSGLGSQYAIYPENARIVAHGWIGARPIIYDTTRFEVVRGGSFSFPRMRLDHPEKQPVDFPLLRLKDRVTGQEFVVLNVHFAAFKRYAKERWESGTATANVVREQSADGTAVVLLGDFNSQFVVRQDVPNITFQGKRENLAYCQFTEGGLMNNARDLSDGFTPGSYCPRTSGALGVDHIYLSAGSSVRRGGYGEVTGTLSDHNTAPFADVALSSAVGGDAETVPAKNSFVGVSPAGDEITLQPVKTAEVVGVLRLTIADPTLVASGEWKLFMAAGTYTYSGNSYGSRIHPVTGELDFHNGMDLGADCGTPLYAMNNGVVRSRSPDNAPDGAWGNFLEIDYGQYSGVYAHMQSPASGLPVGAKVKSGEQVGVVGNTGLSTDCHLHFTVATGPEWRFGDQNGTVDPLFFLEQIGITADDLG